MGKQNLGLSKIVSSSSPLKQQSGSQNETIKDTYQKKTIPKDAPGQARVAASALPRAMTTDIINPHN